MIVRCSARAAGDPDPPRPVVQPARSSAVEPWSLVRRGSAPASSRASTAAEQRLRTARCSGVTPPAAAAFGSAPDSTSQVMIARCPRRIPHGRSRSSDRRRVQGLGAAPVARCDVGVATEEFTGHWEVVAERRRVQRRVAGVHLGVTFGDEELVGALEAGGGEQRRGVEEAQRERSVTRADRPHQRRETLVPGHAAPYIAPLSRNGDLVIGRSGHPGSRYRERE